MIDLRSDTVTRPTDAMRAVMAAAPVGDDVYGDDPTVNDLERYTADLLGKEAAVFVTSGTQSNLCGLLAHCSRGDEYIVGNNAHTYRYEAGGAAVLGSIQPQPIPTLANGLPDLDEVVAAIKPNDHHFARSRLLCLENTHDGNVQTVAEMTEAAELAREHGLAVHLDGARLWNAAAALGAEPASLAAPFDTVSVCLSKGLGAPVGSVLVGPDALIYEARKYRKMLGGATRQAGIIAAGAKYALEHHRGRIADDHTNAAALAAGLAELAGVTVDRSATNMVFATLDIADDATAKAELHARGVIASIAGAKTRLVTHLDVSASDIAAAVTAFGEVVG